MAKRLDFSLDFLSRKKSSEKSSRLARALDDFGIEKITKLANEIYDNGNIPEISIFIMIPKIPGATECELHRTISIMCHIIKLILRVIMTRVRKVLRPEILQTQCGFMADAGTRNATFMIRFLSDKTIEKQKDLYICFLDYTAFDRVKHGKIIELLQRLDTDRKDI